MSKISEQKALEEYPTYYFFEKREGYIKGYDQAFQYFMEKAEEFLYLQLNNGSIECGNIEKLIDDFKNYIQNE